MASRFFKQFLKQNAGNMKMPQNPGVPPQTVELMIQGAILLIGGGYAVNYAANNMLYTVDPGHAAIIFNQFSGLDQHIVLPGTHLKIPWVETPYIFDVRARPESLRSPTGTRDLQTADITLRVLHRPIQSKLPVILNTIGLDYDQRILPSIATETLKSVVAQFNASELITQREQVSRQIKEHLIERANDFHIALEDVSITHLSFGKEYRQAIEAKQVAQQEAERAKYIVKQAQQEKRSIIIKALGEAQAVELLGKSLTQNDAFLTLRRLDAAKQIASTLANGKNTVYLDASALMQGSLGDVVAPSKIINTDQDFDRTGYLETSELSAAIPMDPKF